MRRSAFCILACLACFSFLVDEGEAQKVVGRHPGSVMRAALSSDGELLATGDTNGIVRLLDARTGQIIHSMAEFRQEVDWLGFKMGSRYLVGRSFSDIRIWDAASGELKAVSRELNKISTFAFSPNGQTVAAKKWNSPIQLWDVETGELKRELEAVSEEMESLVFSHDGRLIAGAGDEGVYIWDAATGELKTRFATPVDSLDRGILYPHDYRIAFLPDNRSIASLSHTKYDQQNIAAVHVWDAETGQNQLEFGGNLTGARFAPDGSALAARSGGKFGLWDLRTGEELTAFEEGFDRPVFSPDSRFMAVSRHNRESDTRTIQIWDMEARALASVIESGNKYHTYLSSNSLLTATVGITFREAEFTRFDIQGRKTAQFLVPGSSEIMSLSFSPDGRSVASSCSYIWLTDYAIRIWDVSTGEEKRHIRAYSEPSVFSPDGRTIAGVNYDDTILVWDAETGEQVVELKSYSPSSLAYSPDGKTIAFNNNAVNQGGIVHFLDISTGKAAAALTAPSGWVYDLSFSRDGSVLAAAGSRGSVHLWDVETREILQTVEGVGSVYALALSPSGGSIAVGGEDSIVRVWSAKNGALRGKMIGHEGAVHALAYSPDGQHIASAGEDGTVRIWSAKTFQLKKTLRGHVGWVNAVAFSPDSRSLVSGGKDGRVLFWRFDNLPILWSDAKRPNSPLILKNALLPNYPNPFNPETWIPFDLAQRSAVTIAIYNSTGQTVRRMELDELAAGSYRAKGKAAYWDGRDALGAPAASGVYFVRIEAGSFSETRRMVLLK
ncbi:MAG: PQQ-binding-like beta-propeller repeat protein [Candidatus Poribacteria bacterium]|nr:PQQ-binding-like beta-propeller repeat protein [Candidatus Poribacteria bacterium]